MSKGEYGSGTSFVLGLLISTFGSIIIAIILGILLKDKFDSMYWVGAFFGLFLFLVLTAFLLGLSIITSIGDIFGLLKLTLIT